MKKPKILFLVQLPPPIHGASAVNKAIRESKYIKDQFTTKFVNISPARDLADIGKISFIKIIYSFQIYILSMAKFFSFRPDLIYLTISPHGFAFYKDGLIALSIKAFGGNIAYHLHGKGIKLESSRSKIKNKIYKIIFKGANVIHLSESLFKDLEGIFDETKKKAVVANGIAPSSNTSNTKKHEIFTFVYLSNLVRLKGADIVIRAANLIPPHLQSKFQVKIIGRKSSLDYSNEIARLTEENPYKNIKIMGPRYGAEKIEELEASHVFVLPTMNDCFPLAILEAMASKLAVISTEEGAIPEIVDHGKTGEILDQATPEKLSAAMIKHLKNPDYSSSCAEAGHLKFIEKYTTQEFERNLAQALHSFLKN